MRPHRTVEIDHLLPSNTTVNCNIKDANGNTELHLSCVSRNFNKAMLLPKYSAYIDERNIHGLTPMMIVLYGTKCVSNCKTKIKNEIYQVLEWLLFSGANPNVSDNKGNTVLHHAVTSFVHCVIKMKCIDLLIENGANPYIKNYQGKTAYDIAAEWSSAELIGRFIGCSDSKKMLCSINNNNIIAQDSDNTDSINNCFNRVIPSAPPQEYMSTGDFYEIEHLRAENTHLKFLMHNLTNSEVKQKD